MLAGRRTHDSRGRRYVLALNERPCMLSCVTLWISCVILCTMGMRCIGPNRHPMLKNDLKGRSPHIWSCHPGHSQATWKC